VRAPLRRAATALAALPLLLALPACSPDEARSDDRLTVLAAASLTESFEILAQRFEADHPGVEVATSFDSSATIAAQVDAGAPADVVATADPRTMELMADVVEDPATFARNKLALVVPPDDPAGVGGLADLQQADYVVCAPSAPCGSLAADLLEEAGVSRPPRSREVDVKAVLAKVALGEADAGLVYASDVVTAGDRVRRRPLPSDLTAATSYPIAVVTDAAHPDLAAEWVDLVLSDEGQQVLQEAGFTPGAGG
jgi:molybdate transport system substrate-binding protein